MTDSKPNLARYYLFFAVIGCISIVVSVFSLMHTKQAEADEKLDERISKIGSDIQALDYKDEASELPDTLDGVTNESLEGITYKKIDGTHYELCAVFKTSTLQGRSRTDDGEDTYLSAYEHKKGEDCFKAKVEFFSASTNKSKLLDQNNAVQTNAQNTAGQPGTLCDVQGTFNSGSVGTIDTQQKRIYQQGAAATSTNFIRYDSETEFLDKNCKIVLVSNLKQGSTIQFVSNMRNGQYYADVITLQ